MRTQLAQEVQSSHNRPTRITSTSRRRLVGATLLSVVLPMTACSTSPPSTSTIPPPPVSETFLPPANPSESTTQKAHTIAAWSCAALGLSPVDNYQIDPGLAFSGTSDYPQGRITEVCNNSSLKPLPPQFQWGTCLVNGMLAGWSDCMQPIWICGISGEDTGWVCDPYQVSLAPSPPAPRQG